ncbi:MAG: Rid family detoxifying hydrolase [Flavobacteriales bacterium]|jgi:2-iminobutanoate/2-iminopropanoate deaminase|nr:Rid family detoxifying hydrolase [Flavobacteriales bacterium]
MKKAIISENAPKPIGPYNQAVVKGNQLFVSGQIAIHPKSGELEINQGITHETFLVLSNLMALVEEAGFEKEDIVKCSIFLKDMNDFNEMNEAYAQVFSENPPAREAVQVVKLPKDVHVEISCIAVK